MIRRIPKRRALVLRGDLAPVITHLPMVWNDWRYRWAWLRRRTVADLYPAPVSASAPATAAPWDSVPIPPQLPLVTAANGHRNDSASGNDSLRFPAWRAGSAGSNGSSHPWDRP